MTKIHFLIIFLIGVIIVQTIYYQIIKSTPVIIQPNICLNKGIVHNYALFLFYSWDNKALLYQTLRFIQPFKENIILIDNTLRLNHSLLGDLVGEIFVPTCRLTFSQLLNTARNIGISRNFTFFFLDSFRRDCFSKNKS